MKKLIFLFAVLFGMSLFSRINAQSPTLKVGDKAPDLRIQKWIRGNPVKRFKPGKYYLIELSAVGCGPCRLAIPHLSSIAEEYKDKLEVVSVYTMESNREDIKDLTYISNIENFINKMGDRIKFTVAADVPQQYMFDNWGVAAGLTGIPSSFLINENGKILWLGYVQEQELDKVISAAFSKGANIEKISELVTRESDNLKAAICELYALKKSGNITTAIGKVDSLIAISKTPELLYRVKFELFAGVDDDRANNCLQWILDHRAVDNFDWYHLIYESYTLPKSPNFHIAHQIADRAIEQAPTNTLVAFAMLEKARIYYAQKMLQGSVDLSSMALLLARKDARDGNSPDVAVFEENAKWFKEKINK